MTLQLAVRQGTPAWLEARKSLITATDIGVLLGLNPYRCEADLADEKRGIVEPTESTLRMRVGLALEDLIAAEYEAKTGHKTRRWTGLAIHPSIEWAGASPDRKRKGALVELKHTGSRSRFADGLPQDVEAQVQWQMGVTGYQHADVAVLTADELLPPFEVDFDAALFDNLVAVATDFRRRLEAGGPFARDTARIKRDYPADDGSEMVADSDLDLAAKTLADLRARRKAMEQSETALEDTIKSRMGEIATVRGQGWHATWKRTKDSEVVDFKSLSTSLLSLVPETDREPLIGIHTNVRPGFRPFRLVIEKESDE